MQLLFDTYFMPFQLGVFLCLLPSLVELMLFLSQHIMWIF